MIIGSITTAKTKGSALVSALGEMNSMKRATEKQTFKKQIGK